MDLFLKILGIAFLTLIVLGIAAFYIIRRKLRGFMKALVEAAEEGNNPVTITLLSIDEADDWTHPNEAQEAIKDLVELGFVKVGIFAAEEIPSLRLAGFIHPQLNLNAAVTDHRKKGVFVDIEAAYEDGTTFTSTSLAETGLNSRPGHPTIRPADKSPKGLLAALQEQRPQGTLLVPTAENFAADYEKFYAEYNEWMVSKGGVTREEFERVAALDGTTLSPEQMDEAFRAHREGEWARLEILLYRQLEKDGRLSGIEEEELVYVYDLLDQKAADERIARHLDDEPTPTANPTLPVRDYFRSLNDALPADKRLRPLTTLSHPVQADVYTSALLPEVVLAKMEPG